MFDHLVQSNAHNTVKQSAYFGITTLVYGAILTVIMVWSVFSFDLSSLNEGALAYSELVTPVELPQNVPPPPILPDKPQSQTASASPRQNIDRIKDPVLNINNATKPPNDISTVRSNATQVRERVPFIVSGTTHLAGSGDNFPSRIGEFNGSPDAHLSIGTLQQQTSIDPAPQLPKAVLPVKKDITVSKGVINGIATSLPKPAFSPAARAVHASGEVKVQVLIDERGNVVSATPVSGHPLLRAAAQQAARQAKFTPTQLSNQPVKVTGVIVYNFIGQ